jgi:hypothetical protein
MYVSPFLSRSPGQSRLPIEDSDSTTCIVFVSSSGQTNQLNVEVCSSLDGIYGSQQGGVMHQGRKHTSYHARLVSRDFQLKTLTVPRA